MSKLTCLAKVTIPEGFHKLWPSGNGRSTLGWIEPDDRAGTSEGSKPERIALEFDESAAKLSLELIEKSTYALTVERSIC